MYQCSLQSSLYRSKASEQQGNVRSLLYFWNPETWLRHPINLQTPKGLEAHDLASLSFTRTSWNLLVNKLPAPPPLCQDLLLTIVPLPTGHAAVCVSLIEQGLVHFKRSGSHLEAVSSSMEHLGKSRDIFGWHSAGCGKYRHQVSRGQEGC